jgi:hypothetical protein
MNKKMAIIILFAFLPLAACSGTVTDERIVGTAKVIKVFESIGESAAIKRGVNQTFARAGSRLSDNDVAVTGAESNIYLLLNAESILKMDESSRVEVNRVSESNLSLTLLEGAIAANITRQEGMEYEIRVGNSTMGIRGTSFIIEYREDDIVVVMLSGSGEIDGVMLEAGNAARIEEEIHIVPLEESDISSPFILNELAERENNKIAFGEMERLAVFALGAAHTEGSIILEFDLIEISLNEGFPVIENWPVDGDYVVRLYNETDISIESFMRDFSFIVNNETWSCGKIGCINGWLYEGGSLAEIEKTLCECHEEYMIFDW